jgi:1-deoxy-D-xylulose-5-phosphate synthase
MILEKVNNPQDLKMLNIKECEILSQEIRNLILTKVSKCGGHLGSNLGVVELIIALHYVFDTPNDKIVYDVSHQSMTHKMLTGRKDAFLEVEKYGLVSGYTNTDESEYDLFKIGHTSTSISLACGLAKARDLVGGTENIIAVIGDGSLSGGEAFEGLNYAGSDLTGNMIIVVNDNQNSISENHGGLYQNLKLLRDTNGKAERNFFKSLGYEYKFVRNGNHVSTLIETLLEVKGIGYPVVVHVCTVKGKGYWYAEKNPEITHFVKPFYLETGKDKKPFFGERYDRILRDFLIKKMRNDRKVAVIMPAVSNILSFTPDIREKLGDQFIDVAIAEEHGIAMAAGMAKAGMKPIFVTKASFFQRTYDQISQEICINKMSVTMIVINASIYASTDLTHIGIFDIAMMSNIPNLVYLAPTNKQEYIAMVDWSIEQNDYPVAIRAPRNGVFEAEGEIDKEYSNLNKYKVARKGERAAIIALGDFFQLGEKLAEKIERNKGYKPTLINPRYITGIDEELLSSLIANHNLIITLEDGILDGGFGEKIARFYGTTNIRVMNYGLKKEFLDRYNVEQIMKENHLDVDIILNDIELMD